MLKSFLLFSFVILSGCSYTLVKPSYEKVYVKVFTNHTLQPKIESYVYSKVKKTLVEKEGFQLVETPQEADIILDGKITDFVRAADFFSPDEQILMASYRVKIELTITKDGKDNKQAIEEVYHLSLAQNFDLTTLLTQLSDQIANRIYFLLLKDYGE